MKGRGIKISLIFGLSNCVDAGVTAEMEKILGGVAGIGKKIRSSGRETVD